MQVASFIPFVLLVILGAGLTWFGGYKRGRRDFALNSIGVDCKKCAKQYPNDTGSKAKLWIDLFTYGGIAIMGIGMLYGRMLTSRVDRTDVGIGQALFGRGFQGIGMMGPGGYQRGYRTGGYRRGLSIDMND